MTQYFHCRIPTYHQGCLQGTRDQNIEIWLNGGHISCDKDESDTCLAD